MRNSLKILIALFLSCFILESHAIRVSVYGQSSAAPIAGIGFGLNGKDYGRMGSNYSTSNVPAGGSYAFGMRVNGIFGDDVTCYANGKKWITLKSDTTAYLKYDGRKCTATLVQKK